jgi:hypothetical protein
MYLSDVTRRKPDWWATDRQALALEREAKSACTGVRVPRRLTRRTPVQRQLDAEKRVRLIPALFEMRATVEAERKAGHPLWQQHRRDFEIQVARAFGPGYRLTTEADELAKARCELARAKVDAWLVLSPAALAARITREPRTEKERIERRLDEMLKKP